MRQDAFTELIAKIKSYKKKYYLNLLLKGSLFLLALLTTTYILVTTLEYYGRFNTLVRFVLFSGFIILAVGAIFNWVFIPLSKLFSLRKQLSDEEAAKQIGTYFPNVKDKLLNTIQLGRLSDADNTFIAASIEQKTKELTIVDFNEAINFGKNKKYVKYISIPLILLLAILLFTPQIFTESTARIIRYNKEFTYPAPFEFVLQNEKLKAFRNENFEIKLETEGDQIPEDVYLINNGRRWKMKKDSPTTWSYTFRNLQRTENFTFEGAGYFSENHELSVYSKPGLRNSQASLKYPSYLNKKPEVIKNSGNITVPEGTQITFDFFTTDTDQLLIKSGDSTLNASKTSNGFRHVETAKKSRELGLELENKYADGKELAGIQIEVIPDQYPSINAEKFTDTVLYKFISLGGNISDDHGLTKLQLHYKISETDQPTANSKYKSISIPIDTKSKASNFFFDWQVDTLKLQPGQNIDFYLEVWDNDAYNGNKSTKTSHFSFKVPEKKELRKELKEGSKKAEKDIEKAVSKANQLQKEVNQTQEKLRSKKNLDWQDKKMLEDLLKKHNELNKELDQIKEENKKLKEREDKFSEVNPELNNKMEQLQKLMDDLLDEDTKKLYEELQKLLEENANKDHIQKTLDEIKKKDNNMEKELERTLEMFKELQFEKKLDELTKDLKDISEKQKELSEKSKDKKADNEALQKEQEQLNEDFEQIKEDLKDLQDLNKTLENKKDLFDTKEKEEDISNDLKNSLEQLQKNQNKKAGSSQKDASEKMKKMSEDMQAMQEDMQEEQAQENLDDLRAILENLLTLSFEQEELMKEFKAISQSDPRYITLSQRQLKLRDDSRIIEDSLMSLAKRVFQIRSFVTREVTQMKDHMDASMEILRERQPRAASGKQQFAMTSINNLALMLSDVMQQMQEQMANQMSGPGKMCQKNKGSKDGEGKKPNLGDLQKQLNERIQQLQKEGKGGEGMSKELAKMAAQQEMIRNAMKEMQKSGGKEAGKELNDLMEKMEETETDLIHKRITQETLKRQEEIMTRLLEAEKAEKERELDDERESNTGKELQRELPPSFEKYLKTKEQQIDFLKTVSPTLNPYYKNEADQYFQKIEK
ncbi:DUF4175 family protein [Cytophagaceae bacterium ABcell3]|nr:DUF4175 family protein [Cytophagaceae bacterium ABcell3]